VLTFSSAQAWHPTVGLPLNSNVRQHTKPQSTPCRLPANPNPCRRGRPSRLQSRQSVLHCTSAKPACANKCHHKQKALNWLRRSSGSAPAGNSIDTPGHRMELSSPPRGQRRCRDDAKNKGPAAQHHDSALLSKAKGKHQNSAFHLSRHRQRWGVVQAGRAVTRCCLTLHSRGRPNGMSHWPPSAGACAPFCACCPLRHAVGLPLNSNVRPHERTA
jgi:hypothetical protein